MLTGGSPTMHPALVNELTHFANERNITITIETEGSAFVETDYPIGLISLSPKFSNSVPVVGAITPAGKVADERFIKTHNRYRMNTDSIKRMIKYHTDYHFKPVWDGTDENLKEIEDYRIELDIPKDKTYIMPAGDSRETLIKMYPLVFNMCVEHGYNMTGRDHIIAFDKDRGVQYVRNSIQYTIRFIKQNLNTIKKNQKIKLWQNINQQKYSIIIQQH